MLLLISVVVYISDTLSQPSGSFGPEADPYLPTIVKNLLVSRAARGGAGGKQALSSTLPFF